MTRSDRYSRQQFETLLQRDLPALVDGAMGTLLHSRGIPLNTAFESLNVSDPGLIGTIHREYIEAGADIIETNTFGANRSKLAQHGLADQVPDLNRAAVEIAKRARKDAKHDIWIAGSIGPLGVRLAPFGRVQAEQAEEIFQEQIRVLIDASVDVLLMETHTDLHEIRAAVLAARAEGDIPIIASMTFTRDDRTLLGDRPAEAARFLNELGVDVIGANCSGGPAQLLRILGDMRSAAPSAKFCLMPNAGWPEHISGRVMYPATAEYFGEYALAFCEAGATLIGGCCGTTPAHIAEMHRALAEQEAPCSVDAYQLPDHTIDLAPHPADNPTQLAQALTNGRFVITVELDPPRSITAHKLIAGAHLLAEAGADVINVADSPMARMRMSPWAICHLIQQQVGLETVLHFPTRGRNVLRLQGDLLATHALGVRNIFIVMGDPTKIGDFPDAMDDYDLVPSGLIRLVKQNFNSGTDLAGIEIGDATAFYVGCALNLNPHDPDREMRVFHKKITSGADFALTQPIYDPGKAIRFLSAIQERYAGEMIPVLVGVLPLYTYRHALFLHHEVPGIKIPEATLTRMETAGENAAAEGVRIATELIDELRPNFPGIYIMPPFNRYEIAAEIIEHTRAALTRG